MNFLTLDKDVNYAVVVMYFILFCCLFLLANSRWLIFVLLFCCPFLFYCVLLCFNSISPKTTKIHTIPSFFTTNTNTQFLYIHDFFGFFFFFYFYLGRRLFSWLGTLFFLLVSFACAFFLILQKFLLSIASNSIYNFFNIFFWITLAYLLIFFQKTLYFINNFIYIQIYLHLF